LPNLEKRYVPLKNGIDFTDRVNKQIDENTRAIIVDQVHFLSGFRLDLKELGDLAAKHNLFFIVDGIQALGAASVNLQKTNVHFYTAGGMKWLLGPMGTGFLYVNQNILDKLKIYHVGWLSVDFDDLSSLYPIKPLTNSARRFERANFNLIGLYGLLESLKIMKEIGKEEIEKIILSKTKQFINRLKLLNCEILTPEDDKKRAGIVSFRVSDIESKEVYEKLEKKKIICSLREGWIRISIHFFNTEEELDKVLEVVNKIT